MIEKKVELTAKAGREKEFKELLQYVVAESIKEKGCEIFDLFQVKDSSTFVVMEKWSDNKFLEAHRLTPHYLKLKESLDELTEGAKSSLEIIRL